MEPDTVSIFLFKWTGNARNVADLHHFQVDPDPVVHFDADLDPAFPVTKLQIFYGQLFSLTFNF
jgi:hypothetical protein